MEGRRLGNSGDPGHERLVIASTALAVLALLHLLAFAGTLTFHLWRRRRQQQEVQFELAPPEIDDEPTGDVENAIVQAQVELVRHSSSKSVDDDDAG